MTIEGERVSDKTIRSGPMRYSVSLVGNFDGDTKNCYSLGDITFSEAAIRVRRMPTPEQRKVTLWHEILHAVFSQAGLSRLKEEETVIEAASHGIVDVIATDWTRFMRRL